MGQDCKTFKRKRWTQKTYQNTWMDIYFHEKVILNPLQHSNDLCSLFTAVTSSILDLDK